MRVESPDSELRRRSAAGEIELTTAVETDETAVGGGTARRARISRLAPNGHELGLAAGAGAAAMVVSSSGEVVLLAVLLGLAAADAFAGAVALLALGAVALRWGTTSLDAIAGAQTVLGPGAAVGPIAAAASAACAAAALVLVRARGWAALLFGVTAALIVAGPGAGRPELAVVRAGAAILGAGLALGAQRWAPPVWRRLALGLAAAAVFLAVVAVPAAARALWLGLNPFGQEWTGVGLNRGALAAAAAAGIFLVGRRIWASYRPGRRLGLGRRSLRPAP